MVRKHQTSDVQLHIGESRDSGFDALHRPGMTERLGRSARRNDAKVAVIGRFGDDVFEQKQ
jgi:hypothetical protein